MASPAERQNTIRALSPFETFFTAVSATVWLSVRLRGPLDRAALAGALRVTQAAYPVLRQKITFGEQGFVLAEGEGQGPPVLVKDVAALEEPELWALTPGSGLVALSVVSAGDEHVVSFGAHHGVADARSVMHYHTQFWAAYTKIATTGSAPEPVAAPMPSAPEALLRERGVVQLPTGGVERLDGTVWGGRPATGSVGSDEEEERRIALEAETTSALRRAGKARGVSLHGMVCGAILKAERSLVSGHPAGPVGIGLRSSVDIRERIDPPIGIVEGTNLVAMAYTKAVVDEASDPFELGSRMLADLAADLASGLVQQQIYHVFEDFARMRTPSLYVTNVGEFQALPTPAGLVVEDMRGTVRIKAVQLPGADRMPAPSENGASTYMVYAYGGRLTVEAHYPGGAFTSAEVDRLAAEVESNLREMADAG
ncbi:phthiocerol/phthiodiolone dimycocerosyl transferase family protein [Segniliparus rugosus]|uniref:Phthiocerol/phthiodiolone dimycocerosyl transferase n=1 Tax=Segniliparus rugosus (strain ATCC BAA-974 / DSM 45345 / CCUG 50838 / CIP 108380 / JCM 13579 / CDC 945) TaxID=679197 RepID=E5XU53_SEGRC|nr:hypothetical protein [Segniliparus rugosus]EFV12116.1 hypothetical protein HMPREF9336_03025 [Segniliparus rugosus ATCC BAA-974]